jgi:hypothetical protein
MDLIWGESPNGDHLLRPHRLANPDIPLYKRDNTPDRRSDLGEHKNIIEYEEDLPGVNAPTVTIYHVPIV